ncbi:MAG: carbon-nitrogen hydrolase family protein [Armatimonadota bacterium]
MTSQMQSIHIACGQLVARPGDIDHQLQQIEDLSARAAAQGARLILFAEGALTGYLLTPEMLQIAVSVDSEPAADVLAISKARDIIIVVGTLERNGEQLHMSQLIAYPDGRLLVQRKHNLTPTELNAGLTPGPEERTIFTVDGVRFAVSICADSGIPDLYNKLAAQGCQVSLHPCAGGGGRQYLQHQEDLTDPALREKYIASMEKVCFFGATLLKCADHRIAMVATNLAGDDGVSNYHPGHSGIIDSRGCTIALQPGEYIVEYLRPLLIHGPVTVQEPRQCAEGEAPACACTEAGCE